MSRPTGPSVLLLLLLGTLCLYSAEEKVILEVLYRHRSLTVSRGSSVKLSCNANYDQEQCGLVQVVWIQSDRELTDPSKYITTVNETVSEGNMRLRQVVTEILDLTTDDTGQFQCKAKCEKGETAMGHFIWIKVEARSPVADDSVH